MEVTSAVRLRKTKYTRSNILCVCVDIIGIYAQTTAIICALEQKNTNQSMHTNRINEYLRSVICFLVAFLFFMTGVLNIFIFAQQGVLAFPDMVSGVIKMLAALFLITLKTSVLTESLTMTIIMTQNLAPDMIHNINNVLYGTKPLEGKSK